MDMLSLPYIRSYRYAMISIVFKYVLDASFTYRKVHSIFHFGKNRESGTYKAPKRTIQCVKGAQHLDDYPIYVLGT